MDTNTKLAELTKLLKSYRRILVAYSGGVDSSFLLAFAARTLGKSNVLAVTAVSETYPDSELRKARRLGRFIGSRHIFVGTSELKNIKFKSNPVNRCYYCKTELFKKLSALAKKYSMVLCDATNYSDRTDFRPGRLAAEEWKVRSPLLETGITKDEIRKYSRAMKLPDWYAPAQACLASRLPYGTVISEGILRRIEKGESYLKKKGFDVIRLRHHGDVARLEVSASDIRRLLGSDISAIARYLKKLGWRYVTVDIEGYRTGSLNPDKGR